MKNDCYKNANKYDHVLKMYTGNDELRPAMMMIHTELGFAYATNAHSAIKLKSDLCGAIYYPVDKFPNVEAIFVSHKPSKEKSIPISNEQLLHDLFKIEVNYLLEEQECPVCGGEGEGECKCCGNNVECKNCDATGSVPSSSPVAKLEVHGKDIEFNGRNYNYSFLHRVAMTALILGEKTIQVINGETQYMATIFKVGEVEIILMPKLKSPF